MKRISKRTQWTEVVMLMVMGIPVMLYAGTSVIEELNVFSPNTVISSTKVNENFVMLDERIAVYEDAITVDGSGNVGIGTTSPAERLNVEGGTTVRTGGAGNVLTLFADPDYGPSILGHTDSSGNSTNGAYTGTRLRVANGGFSVDTAPVNTTGTSRTWTNRMIVTDGGNVGIGITTPGFKLVTNVALPGTQTGLLINNQWGYGTGYGTAAIRLAFGRDSSANVDYNKSISGAIDSGNENELSSNPTFMSFSTRSGQSPFDLTERMRINSSGNVGIGTTTPGARLSIIKDDLNTGNIPLELGHSSVHANATGSAWIKYFGSNSGSGDKTWAVGNTGNEFAFSFLGSRGTAPDSGSKWMVIGNSGSVGIGTTSPSQKLHVVGKVTADDYLSNSDARLKRDITLLENAVDGIACLQGVTYRWEDPNSSQNLQLGLIAQDVERCYPEVVSTDSKGFKSVSYARLVAPLIEAVKEQQTTISAQQLETRALRAALEATHASLAATNARLARLEARMGTGR